jgi:integrase
MRHGRCAIDRRKAVVAGALVLAAFPLLALAEARRRGDRHRGRISDGADPQAERRAHRNAPTLDNIIDLYLTEITPKKKARTTELYRHYLRKLLGEGLRAKKAETITRAELASLHRELGKKKPVTANRVLVALSGVYSFASRHELVSAGFNPARGIEKFEEKSCERYLSGDELSRLGLTLRLGETEGLPWPLPKGRAAKTNDRKPENQKSQLSPHVTAAFRLLLFTGCRLREILNLRWSEVDHERGCLFLPDSKTGKKTVILNAPTLQVLKAVPRVGEFVILGDSLTKPRRDLKRPWDLIRHHARLADVRIHDLRHTHASIGAGAGLGLPIIGKLLGHKHASTTEKYAHLDVDPLRRASDRIAADLAAAIGEELRPSAEVVQIGRPR